MTNEETRRALAWYARNSEAVSVWLVKHPPPDAWCGSRVEWAYLEMPNPETAIGRVLLRVLRALGM